MATGKGIQIIVGADYNGKDLARAQRDLDKLKRETAAAQGPLSKFGAGMKKQMTPNIAAMGAAAAAAAIALAALAVEMGIKGVIAAAEEEKAITRLKTALDNVGQGFRTAEAESFVDSLQRSVGVADDELRPALQSLTTATGNLTQAQGLLQVALDVSAGTGKDLQTVTTALAKAAGGQFGSLRRLAPALSASAIATGDLNVVTGELTRLYGGQAQNAANTFLGSIEKLQIGANELLESFGKGFIDSFTSGNDAMGDMTDILAELEPAMKDFGNVSADVVKVLVPLLGVLDNLVGMQVTVVTAIQGMTQAASGFGPVATALGAFGVETQSASDSVDNATDSTYALADVFHGPITGDLNILAYGLTDMGDAAEEGADQLSTLNDEMGTFFGFLDKRDAVRGYEAAIDDFSKSLKENGKSFDESTAKGRANQDALDGVFDSAMKVAEGQQTAREKIRTMSAALDEAKARLDNTKMSESAKAALLQPFTDAIGKFRTANTEVDNLKSAMENIPTDIPVTITFTTRGLTPEEKAAFYSADGGLVPQHLAVGGRPRSRGSDTIPAMLSPGEFVVRRSAVNKFGADVFSQLNRGINPLGGMGTSASGSGGSGLTINGGITVQSGAGERAEESLPRALRRLAFVAGM